MQQATDFAEESAALHALIESLSEAELATPTLFKAWTIEDVIGHLHVWNLAAGEALKSREAFADFAKELGAAAQKGGALRQTERSFLGGLMGASLVDAWAAHYPRLAAEFEKADPSSRLAWVGPDMSARSSITARLMETWAHAQAVYDALGSVRKDTDRIRNIVILGVNTFGWTFRNRGLDVPAPVPHLVLTAPSGEIWRYGEESAHERIEGEAAEFCQVVTQTRNIADTRLRVTGETAQRWMAMAQCFAGRPETPPPPGARHRAKARA
jgi:uncharacterized protein (TIGR03084 family)